MGKLRYLCCDIAWFAFSKTALIWSTVLVDQIIGCSALISIWESKSGWTNSCQVFKYFDKSILPSTSVADLRYDENSWFLFPSRSLR